MEVLMDYKKSELNYNKEDSIESRIFDNRIWLNSKEAAEYLRISVNNLRVKVSRGEIPVHGRLGKTWRFRREKLDNLLLASS